MHRHVLVTAGVVWVPLAAIVSLGAVAKATPSGRAIITAAAIIGVTTAVLAVVLLVRDARRLSAFGFFLSSIATPSTFAYVLNLLPLAVAVSLVMQLQRQAEPRR
jgi:hypothetical protein